MRRLLSILRSSFMVPAVLCAACAAAALWLAPDVFEVLFTLSTRPGSDPSEWFGRMMWSIGMVVGLLLAHAIGITAALLGWGTATPAERPGAAVMAFLWLLSLLVWQITPDAGIESARFVAAQAVTLGLGFGTAAVFWRRAQARWRARHGGSEAAIS